MTGPAGTAMGKGPGKPARAARDERLLDAVLRNDAAGLRRALRAGADPNARDEGGLTPLMHAAGRGLAGTVRTLIAAGADPNALDARAGSSPLHKACQNGSLTCARLLIAAGAFVDLQAAGTGHTPLIEAMWFKNVGIVAHLLARGARIGLRTAYGFTVLDHLKFMAKVSAKGGGKIRRIQKLFTARLAADRRAARRQGLMAATVAGDAARARALLDAGAAVDERAPIVGGFNDAHTPLLVASRDGHADIVRLLLAAGADVNAVEPTFGAVPLHKATYNGHAEIVRLLAAAPGADLDYQGPSNGYTPLHDALWHGFGGCARILVEAGARLDLAGHDGLTPLDLACKVLGRGDPVTRLIGVTAKRRVVRR